ncbi:MAG: GH92 family glycosyl hydrolase [Deltaproteobacteria bacterium]|nr:GH92 family glycosyl hydrolase [Deltaproteobacteria bacterium]
MKEHLHFFLFLCIVVFFVSSCSDARNLDVSDSFFEDINSNRDVGMDVGGDTGKSERLINYVNVFSGTGGIGFGVGSMIPGATAPFSMMKLSPDTAMSNGAVPFYHCAGYYYEDEYIVGFTHNHLPGVGVPDQGNILFMPVIEFSDDMITWTKYRSPLDHSLENGSPGYYSVFLKDREVLVELTVRNRSGIHRYTYKGLNSANAIIVDLDAAAAFGRVEDEEIVIDAQSNSFYGYAKTVGDFASSYGGLKVYFYAISDRKIKDYKIYKNLKSVEGNSARGDNIKAIILFDKTDVLNIKVGISYVDVEGAKRNLMLEIPDFDFENYRKKTEEEWEKMLSLIKIKTENKRDKNIFYTAMYHLFQMPTVFTDVDKRYRGFDNQIHIAEDFVYYTDFSLWDTYRTFHPLVSLLLPQLQRDFNISLIKMYEQGGYLPRWPMGTGDSGSMVGESANIVLADSLMRGVVDWDVEKAFEAMLKTADKPKDPNSYYGGRDGIEEFINLGYVPADKYDGSVSKTQEYSYNDFAIAYISKYLGKEDEYRRFIKRASHYKNLFNYTHKFFIGRNTDGTFVEDFIPTSHSKYYVEGNGWQYRFFVPYDSLGLIELFGGKDNLLAALNELFIKSEEEFKAEPSTLLPRRYYWHSNEPCILIPYIYCDIGECNLTNKWNRWIFRVSYKDSPDGLPGNDDGGTMSAWYIMSSLGILMLPIKDYYMIGAPLFQESEINFGNKKLSIITENFSRDKYRVKKVLFNNKEISDFKIRHSELIRGGEVKVIFE